MIKQFAIVLPTLASLQARGGGSTGPAGFNQTPTPAVFGLSGNLATVQVLGGQWTLMVSRLPTALLFSVPFERRGSFQVGFRRTVSSIPYFSETALIFGVQLTEVHF